MYLDMRFGADWLCWNDKGLSASKEKQDNALRFRFLTSEQYTTVMPSNDRAIRTRTSPLHQIDGKAGEIPATFATKTECLNRFPFARLAEITFVEKIEWLITPAESAARLQSPSHEGDPRLIVARPAAESPSLKSGEDEGERCRRDRMGLTDQFGAQPEEQILDIERETAIANARLRELVDEK